MDDYDPDFVKWLVQTGTQHYGPFDSRDDAQKWVTGTHSEGCLIYPLFPGVMS